MGRSFLIFGCGYLGLRAAEAWLTEGAQVSVVTRSAERAREFAAIGLQPIIGDVVRPETLRDLPACDCLLYSIGYDRTANVSRRAVTVDGLQNALTAVGDRCGRWIQISSTSVYGQIDGEWVDEESLNNSVDESGALQCEAEQLAFTHRNASVLRLSGIYGPKRLLSRAESLRAGTPIAGDPEGWLNLIHVDDAVRAVRAAADRGVAGRTYLVSDDAPLRRREYYDLLAKLLQCPSPAFSGAPGARGTSNKRCRNSRMKEELRVTLHFPTVETGLPAAVDF